MNRKKLFLKTFNESYKKKKHSNIFSLKKDIETVQKLNMQNYPSPENTKNESISRNKKRNNSLLTNEDREKLKKQTKVGALIKFRTDILEEESGHFIHSEVAGCVVEKYSHIFKLHDGHYYKWVDYLIGFIY